MASAVSLNLLNLIFRACFSYSLSIASVPLSGAYVFVSSYSALPVFLTGLAMVSSAPLLVAIATRHALRNVSTSPHVLMRRELLWALLRALSCAASAFLQRHHLFVWSVFGPLVLWACVHLVQDLARIAFAASRQREIQ